MDKSRLAKLIFKDFYKSKNANRQPDLKEFPGERKEDKKWLLAGGKEEQAEIK